MPEFANSSRRAMTIFTIAAVSAIAWYWYRGESPPQLGTDQEVFAAVDALFTAINARDATLLDHCQKRLENLSRDGKINAAATACLDEIVVNARSGAWEASARRLYDFMRGQRRNAKVANQPTA